MSTRILFANSFTVMIDEDQPIRESEAVPILPGTSHACEIRGQCEQKGCVRAAFCFLPQENAPTGRSQRSYGSA